MKRYIKSGIASLADEGWEEQYQCVIRPDTPAEALSEIADSPKIGILEDIAKHPNISTEIVEKIAQSRNTDAKIAVVRNPNVPSNLRDSIYEDLIRDKVRSWISFSAVVDTDYEWGYDEVNSVKPQILEAVAQSVAPLGYKPVEDGIIYPGRVDYGWEGYVVSMELDFRVLISDIIIDTSEFKVIQDNLKIELHKQGYSLGLNPNFSSWERV